MMPTAAVFICRYIILGLRDLKVSVCSWSGLDILASRDERETSGWCNKSRLTEKSGGQGTKETRLYTNVMFDGRRWKQTRRENENMANSDIGPCPLLS